MIGKNKLDPETRQSNNSVGGQSEPYNFTKPYSNYVNYQGNAHTPIRQFQREPDHVALYTINTNPNSNNNSLTINRNPYINGPFQLRKEPPKQTLTRNSSNKDQYPSRQSQELIRNKTQNIKSAHKNNSISSKGLNTSLNSSVKPVNSQIQNSPYDLGQAYSQTVDLGSISRKHSMNQSSISNEQQLLNQKIEYLSLLDRSLRDFERMQDVRALQRLSQNNKKIMLGYFEQLNRLKEQKSRKNISDMVSQSDNFSQDAFSIDERSDSRNTSLRIQSEKNKFSGDLHKSRDKYQGKDELNHLVKLNEKLERQYKQLSTSKQQFNNQKIQIEQALRNVISQESKLQGKALELKGKLSGLPFYQQWVLMSNEEEGARKIQIKLKEQLQKRKMKLKQLKQQEGGKQQIPFERKGSVQKLKQKNEITKDRQSSQSKLKSPLPNIPLAPSSQPLSMDSPANRIIQDSSLRIMGVSHQVRNKSINRTLNN